MIRKSHILEIIRKRGFTTICYVMVDSVMVVFAICNATSITYELRIDTISGCATREKLSSLLVHERVNITDWGFYL